MCDVRRATVGQCASATCDVRQCNRARRAQYYVDGAPLQVKTHPAGVSVVQVNYGFDKDLADPDALLDRYTTLTSWSDALADAGAARVSVVQRFHRQAQVIRN